MALEDLVLWSGFVTGILGTIAFIWQVAQAFSSRSQHRTAMLNRNVLKPWSSVMVADLYRPPGKVALFIPKNAFPEESSRVVPGVGLEISELTGLVKAKAYLHRKHPNRSRQWMLVEQHLKDYEQARVRRAEIVESLVREGMAKSYPGLIASTWQQQRMGSFLPETISNVVEEKSYWAAARVGPSPTMTKSRQQVGDSIRYSLSEANSAPLLLGVSEQDADEAKMLNLLTGWITNPRVQQEAANMVKARELLDMEVEEFRRSLKEVNLEIDQAGG